MACGTLHDRPFDQWVANTEEKRHKCLLYSVEAKHSSADVAASVVPTKSAAFQIGFRPVRRQLILPMNRQTTALSATSSHCLTTARSVSWALHRTASPAAVSWRSWGDGITAEAAQGDDGGKGVVGVAAAVAAVVQRSWT